LEEGYLKTCKPWRKAADRKPRSHTVLLVGRVLDGNAGWPHAGGQRVLRGGGQLRQGRFHLAVGWKNTSIDKPGDCESMCSKSFTEVVSKERCGRLRLPFAFTEMPPYGEVHWMVK